MMKIFHVFFFVVVILCGFFSFAIEKGWVFSEKVRRERIKLAQPLPPRKFTFVFSAYNCEDVCKKTLDSLRFQDYPHFSILYIDDGSEDQTYSIAKAYQAQNPDIDLTVKRFKKRKGHFQRLYQTIYSLEKDTIVIPLKGNTWLTDEKTLSKIAKWYQNYDIWLTLGPDKTVLIQAKPCLKRLPHAASLRRSKIGKNYLSSFYAGLFQKVKLQEFFFRGDFFGEHFEEAYLFPMLEMAKEHAILFSKPKSLFLRRDTIKENRPCYESPLKSRKKIVSTPTYSPLLETPVLAKEEKNQKSDYLIFSYNRPLQLYALLESSEKFLEGIEQTFVIYRSSNHSYEKAYEKVKEAFPKVCFIQQSQWPELDFRPLTMETLFTQGKSPYILFAVDDIVFKDMVVVPDAIYHLEKTKAYCFSLRLGKNINYCYMGGFSQEVPNSILLEKQMLAWQIDAARGDWNYPHSLDATLYRKEDLFPVLLNVNFKNPNELEWNWSNADLNRKKRRELIGLCYTFSKAVNLPLNIVFNSNNPHMNLYSAEELLEKFEKGWLLDTESLKGIENTAVHMEYSPKFIKKLRREDTEKSSLYESLKSLPCSAELPSDMAS